MVRKGSDFENWFRNHASRKCFVYRFRDAAILAGTNYRYRIPVPCDFLVIFKGKVLFVECKSARRFTKDKIREVQIEYAKRITEQDVPYIFLIENRETGDIYSLIAPDMLDLYEQTQGKSSTIPWESIALFSFYTGRRRKFDIITLINKAYETFGGWKKYEQI